MITISIIIAVALFIILSVWSVRFEQRKRKERTKIIFRGRESTGSQSFYEKYYKEKGIDIQIITGIKNVLEKTLDADMSRIQPGDDSTRNLKYYFDSDSLADVELSSWNRKDISNQNNR